MPNAFSADEPAAPWFDAERGAWRLSRYADVRAALRDPRLVMGGAQRRADAVQGGVIAPPRWRWAPRARHHGQVYRMAAAVPADVPVDVVAQIAVPWAADLALEAVGAPNAGAAAWFAHAAAVYDAAASAEGDAWPPAALQATAALAAALPASAGALGVQAFVALSQTLPAVLAGAWHVLARHPDLAAAMRVSPAARARGVDELLRVAGPARAVFRRAVAPLVIGGARITAGERVILGLTAANRDPARFPAPDRPDLARRGAGHLAFGAGPHACPAARAVRAAVRTATGALLAAADRLEPAHADLADDTAPVWRGGLATRAPARVVVALRRSA